MVGAHYDGIELAMRDVADAIRCRCRSWCGGTIILPLKARSAQARERYAGQVFDKKDIAGFAARGCAGKGGGVYAPIKTLPVAPCSFRF